jgi:major vault protein
MNPVQRNGDLVLPQGTYVLVMDGASGNVEVVVGPHKVSLADTDKTVVYNPDTRRYIPTAADDAIRTCPTANEGQYIVLHNPESGKNDHPSKGKTGAPSLSIGNKINIPGPVTFALYPGQYAEVVEGHQLKSNEYVLIRVYNESAARENLSNAIMKTVDGEGDNKKNSKEKSFINQEDLFTGNVMVIKGTDVSFYIPPTGIEVVSDENGNYVRKAVTLERLEYCILLDQNGDKRYVQGPAVVFPKPTENFVVDKNSKKFKAIELNDNMGIYVKVISDYSEGKHSYKAGDELFITGKDTKIYFPREEHAIIKYGEQMIHYSTAIPTGEGRYVLDKNTGKIDLVRGPKMFLPDPRKQVIVKRILDDRTVELLFPGNNEALNVNRQLREAAVFSNSGSLDFIDTYSLNSVEFSARGVASSSNSKSLRASHTAVADEMNRSHSYTEPRSITLNTKYDGAVCIDIWPGYAIQVVKKTGERRVEAGPKSVMLEYDETLEVLTLSKGRPKDDNVTFRTPYLQVSNNIVADIVRVETKDLVNVDVTVSYRVNFLDEQRAKWFTVSNYIKLMTQHTRSLLRNSVKKMSIEDFTNNASDIVRDAVLGSVDKGNTRTGRAFEENGMRIYDVEVLNLSINDRNISQLLLDAQHDTVQQNLSIKKAEKQLEYVKRSEKINRETLAEEAATRETQAQLELKSIEQLKQSEEAKLTIEQDKQTILDKIAEHKRNRDKAYIEQEINALERRTNISISESTKKAAAVTPQLTQAIISMGQLTNNKILAENLKAQGGGLAGIFQKGGIEGLLEAVKGTPLEESIINLFSVKPAELTSNDKGKK